MVRSDSAHIAMLLDRSGSMERIAEQAVTSVNAFVDEQRQQAGACTFTLVQFDSDAPQEVVHDMAPIADVAPLTAATYVPRGGTPLLDALGELIQTTGARLSAIPEADRPGTVILVVMTDGQENASRRFSQQQVFDMIQHQREVYQWQVLFLGANQDAIAEASKLGIDPGAAMRFTDTDDGLRGALVASSRAVRTARESAAAGARYRVHFTDEERTEQTDAGTDIPAGGDANARSAPQRKGSKGRRTRP